METNVNARVKKNELFSRFKFITDGGGYIPNLTYILLSSTSAGKSTLIRSIAQDIFSTDKVTYYSSEESIEETKMMFKRRNMEIDFSKNVDFIEERVLEKNFNMKDYQELRNVLASSIINNKSKILIFDNLTTSVFYDPHNPSHQMAVFNSLSSLAREFHIPIFFVAHTKKGSARNLYVSPDDIRGVSTITNRAEIIYTLNTFSYKENETDKIASYVKISKNRFGDNLGCFYMLNFCPINKEFIKDSKVNSHLIELYLKQKSRL